MTQNDIHGIENGWSVKTADGQSIGSVEETTDRYILVKSGLINASHRYLPAATLEHVRPELKEIGISLTAEAVEQGDWSEPPDRGTAHRGRAAERRLGRRGGRGDGHQDQHRSGEARRGVQPPASSAD